MKIVKIATVVAAMLGAQAALAGSHQPSLDACKVAVAEAQGNDARVRLSSLERRGSEYRFWLDVWATAENGDRERNRAYCTARGSNVMDVVTSSGKWDRASKRQVAQEVESRLASN